MTTRFMHKAHGEDNSALIESMESVIEHLDRLGLEALQAATDEDQKRDEDHAAWLTRRFDAAPEQVLCPQCRFLYAVIAYHVPNGSEGNYCPRCEHSWNTTLPERSLSR